MLLTLNRRLNRMMPLITPTSILIGVLLGGLLSPYTYLSPWLFAFMTFAGSISLGFKDFLNVLKKPMPMIVCLSILHLIMPLIALGAGHLAFAGDPYTITGLILGAVIPTGVSSFVWVSIYRGNIAMTLSIILIDTLLAPFIVPGILSVLVGADVHLDVIAMMKSLLWMIVAPSLLGMLLNEWTKGSIAPVWGPRFNPLSKLCMAAVVMINGSVVAPYLTNFNWKLLGLAALIIGLFATGYSLCFLFARMLGWNEGDQVALIFNGGMRNISAGAVLAVSYFPAPVTLPVILGMVFQQVMASVVGLLLDRRSRAGSPLPNDNHLHAS
ncbi:bile acid:sodium symporter family protein [Paenibacillus sp. HN-1]|uniref:bile acid:sodium symporter family protein n=1 Tax=Paenibacillus TaxID=44249 RepID=UPI001CA9718F|nr:MULTISPECIES: bile acid:sodium symporter family protein [Paenibacillus]MBY9081394.1 bile acid:sodium symporter family protein [Paenibacillus sp. CGMCC 1.18879]MBY9084914.1 bile acid:sodium symporter family protein [Paenibacillus sinensis]